MPVKCSSNNCVNSIPIKHKELLFSQYPINFFGLNPSVIPTGADVPGKIFLILKIGQTLYVQHIYRILIPLLLYKFKKLHSNKSH